MALAILAVVLLSSTLITTRAFRLGQTARERTILADAAQVQQEALRSFRDNHTWNEFLNGGMIGGVPYRGVLTANGPGGCVFAPICQHAASTVFGPGLQEYVPVAGSTTGPVPTSYIEIEVTPIPVANPTSVDVVLSYGFQPLGGGPQNVGHIKTTLTNIGLKP